MIQDTVYFISIFLCMGIGGYYKRIDDLELKRNYGAGLGLLIGTFICGTQIYHSVIMVWGNIIIIKCCNVRYAHQLSLAFTWTYLTYLYMNENMTTYTLWLYQTIALRVVGLANEVYLSAKARNELESERPFVQENNADAILRINPTAVDIITYTYYFIGLHKGPYYRWKTFEDHFAAPFGVLGDCRVITVHKLKKALVCCIGYLLLRVKYNPNIYYDEQFYKMFGSELRYLYSLPQLMMFFLEQQVLMMLSTCVFTETGFGVYPAKCAAVPGHGPTLAPSLLKLASTTTEVALKQEFNFAMLKCFNNEKILFGPRMRDTLSGWNLSARYWFKNYIHNQITSTNKELRSACSFAAWWVWSGPTPARLMMAATIWIYVQVEDEYTQLCYEANESAKFFPWNLGFSIMRLFCFLYLAPTFIVSDTFSVLRYYNSIYWVFHFIILLFIIFLVVIYKMKIRPD